MKSSKDLTATPTSGPDGSDPQIDALYPQLRVVASQILAGERVNHTLQPTALVHEVWLRLGGDRCSDGWETGEQFLSAAAAAMKKILIDHARKRKAQKRTTDTLPTSVPLSQVPEDDLLDLTEAIERLTEIDEDAAELVQLRLFAGLSMTQAAEARKIPLRSAYRLWEFAEAWLFRELNSRDE
jgi:RNA polymerase sigma factor (TIGR02999 family)